MADNRNGCQNGRALSSSACGESVIIDTNHVFDSCRDRDCFEDVAVFLSPDGQELIERTTNVRVANASILWSNITVEPVQFNRGFYEIRVRFYVKLELEACVCLGKPAGFTGIAVVEKSVILYGGEGSISVFKSTPGVNGFCAKPDLCEATNNLPTAVVEVASPVVLNSRVADCACSSCCRCCSCDDIPSAVSDCTNGNLGFCDDERHLLVSLGFFSVIRIERPEQYLINAQEYSVPDKECFSNDESSSNPCDVFRTMDFPISEFKPSCINTINSCSSNKNRNSCGCGCDS